MNDLIAIGSTNIGGTVTPTVNARLLHSFLEVKTAFKDWIVRRIEDFGFIEDQDFCSFLSESGGRPSKEYALTLDMGKELSMVERNEKGKQARQYFIECERRSKTPLAALSDPATMRHLLLTYTEKVLALESRVDELQPKADIADRIALSEGSYCLTDAAKNLGVQPKKVFIPWLFENKWIYKRPLGRDWLAYQDKMQAGLLEHKTETVTLPDGTDKIKQTVRVTPKGITKLAAVFNSEL